MYKSVLAALCALLLFSGCNLELREADMLTIVSGIGIDRTDDGYSLSIEIVRPKNTGDGLESVLIASHGPTVLAGMQEGTKLIGHRLFFTHAEALVLGRDTAESGIGELLEAIARQNELPLSIHLLVSEGSSHEILNAKAVMDELKSYELRQTLTSNGQLSESPNIQYFVFANRVLESGVDGYLPYVHLAQADGEPTQKVEGVALFAGDKMVCAIDKDLTQCLLWVAGDTNMGSLSKDGNAFNVSAVRRRITATAGGAVIDMSMEIFRAEGVLDQKQSVEYVHALVESRMEELLGVTRRHGCDPIGIGRELKRYHQSDWEEQAGRWNETYKDYPVEFRLNVKYITSGRTDD